MSSHIKPVRLNRLPDAVRLELIAARRKHGWSQAELGKRAGLPQMHVSGIETGKISPRFDTLLDLVRVLDHDLLLVPGSLVPAVQALIRDQQRADRDTGGEPEHTIYAAGDSEPEGDES